MALTLVASTEEAHRHIGDVECLLWHNGHLISGGDEGKVKVWTPDLKLVTEFQAHDYPIYHMASDGPNFYTCSNDSSIKEWQPQGGNWSLSRTLEAHKQPVRRLRMFDGRLYSGDEAGDVWVWNKGQNEGKFSVNEEIWDMVVATNRLYTVRDREVVISDFADTSTYNNIEGRGPLRVSGSKLVFVDRNNGTDLLIHDNEKPGLPQIGRLQGHTMIINAIIGNPDMFFTAGWDSKIIIWDLNKLTKIAEQPVEGYVNALAMSSVGNLYVAGANGCIFAFKINM